ncbi:MAG TPA: sialidase family protein [Candidatus Brocadiia bacterium]|nr:sialidase family protein [Candidatus Brocadiia bacterium]
MTHKVITVIMMFFAAGAFVTLLEGQEMAKRQKQPAGYSIPLIDISGQKERQVVVDREAGQYLGHVTTVLLEDGKTMICVYPKGHGRGAIVMKRSGDGGLTWSDRLPTPKSWETSLEVPTLFRVIAPGGKKRLIMFSGLYPIRMAFSEDDGATWSELAPIGDFGGIVAMSDIARLKDGRYLAFFHDDGRFFRKDGKLTNVFDVFQCESGDGGLTWSSPRLIAKHPTAHLCEAGCVRSPDGSQLALLFRENSRRHNGFVIFSNDEGRAWSKPAEMAGALTGDRHTLRYGPDGRIVCVFRDMCHASLTKGDFVAWVGRYEDIAQGREGQYRVRLENNTHDADCGYPGLEVLPDGTFVATTYGHWTKGETPYILSVRFKLEEIDAIAARNAPAGKSPPKK